MTAHYDAFAEAYAAENEASILNAYYERPAMLELAGDVAGRHILDAGCGAGPLSEALRARGAEVAGFDASPAMIELARRWRSCAGSSSPAAGSCSRSTIPSRST